MVGAIIPKSVATQLGRLWVEGFRLNLGLKLSGLWLKVRVPNSYNSSANQTTGQRLNVERLSRSNVGALIIRIGFRGNCGQNRVSGYIIL